MTSSIDKIDHTEREIFLRAVEIKSEDMRADFVREHCGQNQKLEERVWTLLSKVWTNQSEFQTIQALSNSKIETNSSEVEQALPESEVEFAEKQVGPYTIIRKIGEGGVSEVYLAQQERPVSRLVALKLIKPGMETSEIFSRFKLEQQALELLSHRGIAKLLDAGFSPMGRPYLVLEYIDGSPITEYCQSHHLELNDRLQIFLRVCESVQHAHQQGILHRDLKPSNILIDVKDNEHAPKIIDFGIAKRLDSNTPGFSGRTQIGQLIGTLEYMSPEQASLGRVSVDMRSDVYALSCILYELLTGRAPHALALEQCNSVEEALRIIQEKTAVRPSHLAATKSEGGLAKWGSDLDWIVMKGLEKSTEARYATVHELMADLQRFLRRDVVLARPQTLLYVAARFSHRYRAAMAMIVITALSVCIGLGASVWGWQTAVAANEAVSARAAEAVEQKEQAENILTFFLAGVEKSKPKTVAEDNLPDMTVEQLLTAYLNDLKEGVQGVPPRIETTVAIEVLFRLGKVAIARYEAEPAATAFGMLVELLERTQPENSTRIFEAKYWLADSYFFGHKDAKAKEILLEICPKSPQTTLECEAITLLARIYLCCDEVPEAVQLHSVIPVDVHSPIIDWTRGDILLRSGQYQQSFDVVSKVLREVEGNPDMTSRCTALLGACLFKLERFEEGLQYYERLVTLEAGLYNKNHLASYDGRGQLLDAYIQCERYEQALQLAQQLKRDVEEESPTSPIRHFLPMLRVRMSHCLIALRRPGELLDSLAKEPIEESQFRGRELFELNSYIAAAHILQGNRDLAENYIHEAQEALAVVQPDQFLWNLSKEKIESLCKRLEISLDK